MLTQRMDYEHGTEILVWNEDSDKGKGYAVVCSDIGMDKGNRVPPTAHIHAPRIRTLTVSEARRRAREYDYVADLAEQLQAEKRAAYAAQFAACP